VSDIKVYGTENPNHHVRNFVSDVTLKGIDKDIFNLIFSWTFDKDVMRWYNAMGPRKVKPRRIYVESSYISINAILTSQSLLGS